VEDRDRLFLGHFAVAHLQPEERFGAAARAGFDGISIWWSELSASDDGESVDRVGAALAAAGIGPAQLEFAPLGVPMTDDDWSALADDMAAAADALGCSAIHAVALGRGASPTEVVRQFRRLCDAGARVGIPCGVEFVPQVSSVETLADALELARATERPSAGVVVDTMHFFRGGEDWDALASMRPEEVVAIQIDDLPLTPSTDYAEEASAGRLLPGRGELDLARFVAAVESIPRQVPFTVEVASRELQALPAEEAVGAMAKAAREVLGLPDPASSR